MIYDIQTKNISFLKVSKQLEDMNITNNKFMLILYDESLINIDPYSKYLTKDQQIKIYKEICINRWYFLREVIRFPFPAEKQGIPYILNLGNCAQTYLYSKNLNTITILPRQSGCTYGNIANDIWELLFGSVNLNLIYFNKNQDENIRNSNCFKSIKNLLPEWLKNMILNKNQDKDNKTEKYFSNLNNHLKIQSNPNNRESLNKLIEKLNASLIYFDNFAFINKNQMIFNNIYQAWKKNMKDSIESNKPYGIRITTTPNSLNIKSGMFAKKQIDDACRFSSDIYDMTEKELHKYVDLNSSNSFVFIQYSWKELGRTQEWYDSHKKILLENNRIKCELDLEWPEL